MSDLIPKIEYNSTTITFDYPPKGFDNLKKKIGAEGVVSEAANGTQQTIVNFLEEEYEIKLAWVSKSITEAFETFLTSHALLGFEFKYFPDKDKTDFLSVTLTRSGRTISIKRLNTTDKYEFDLKMRRVIL